MYAVITCYKCGQLLLAQTEQKTKHCPHCGFRFSVEKSKKIAYAKSSREASALIRRLKSNLKRKKIQL
jgi:DNA-directed RNA polymerase subunit RPC12/RpoP